MFTIMPGLDGFRPTSVFSLSIKQRSCNILSHVEFLSNGILARSKRIGPLHFLHCTCQWFVILGAATHWSDLVVSLGRRTIFDHCHGIIGTSNNWHPRSKYPRTLGTHSKFPTGFLASFRIFGTLVFEATKVDY